jgi:hypothetical protein
MRDDSKQALGTAKINVPVNLRLEPIGRIGAVSNTAVWSVDPSDGTLTCDPTAFCEFTITGQIVAGRVLFTPTKLGVVFVSATSLHDGTGAEGNLDVVP